MKGYCIVRVEWNGGDLDVGQVAHPGTFNEVILPLKQVRNRHADALADDPDAAGSVVGDILGGFGVEIINRFGSVAELGPGRDVWFLFRHEPPPGRCYSDHPQIEGTRVFYLDSGHHTELGADMLVSRDECLQVLHGWLDTNAFPE